MFPKKIQLCFHQFDISTMVLQNFTDSSIDFIAYNWWVEIIFGSNFKKIFEIWIYLKYFCTSSTVFSDKTVYVRNGVSYLKFGSSIG